MLDGPDMLRGLLIVILANACGGGSGGTFFDDPCPADIATADPCTFAGRCWNENTFSSCLSESCTCVAGRVACDAIAPQNGDLCGDEPIDQCSYEGNASCMTLPTSEICFCDDNGAWHCECACYGSQTTCGSCPPTFEIADNARCGDLDATCDYAEGSCTCMLVGDEQQFVCITSSASL